MHEGYDPRSPNEVGKILFTDENDDLHTGLMIVSGSKEAEPLSLELIPPALVDDYSFIMTVSPNVAWFFGALQADADDQQVPEATLSAARIVWWYTVKLGTMLFKEARNEG